MTLKIDCPSQKNPFQISLTVPVRDSGSSFYTDVDFQGKIFPMLLGSDAACSWIGPGPADDDAGRDDGAISLTLDLDG